MNYVSSLTPKGHKIAGSIDSYFGKTGPAKIQFNISSARGDCVWKWKPAPLDEADEGEDGDEVNAGNNRNNENQQTNQGNLYNVLY